MELEQTSMFPQKEVKKPPYSLPGIGSESRAGKVWTILTTNCPSEVNLTTLERVAFTKVTNRISDIRKVCRPLGWDIVNRIETMPRGFMGSAGATVRSWYRIAEWKGD